jgi:hypothetical protein
MFFSIDDLSDDSLQDLYEQQILMTKRRKKFWLAELLIPTIWHHLRNDFGLKTNEMWNSCFQVLIKNGATAIWLPEMNNRRLLYYSAESLSIIRLKSSTYLS